MNLTMMQVGGAFLWGLLGGLPLLLAAFQLAASAKELDEAQSVFLVLTIASQIAFGVACYTAGGIR